VISLGIIHVVVKVEGVKHTLFAISKLVHAVASRSLGGIGS
jgi:hypothetical protein